VNPLRRAALDGLQYAAYLVDYLGWEPCGPETYLHLWNHIGVAAGKTGPENGEHPQDVQGLMGYMLEQLLETPLLFDWEAEPGRTAEEVRQTLLATAAGFQPPTHQLAA
jgi:hypothetical protein